MGVSEPIEPTPEEALPVSSEEALPDPTLPSLPQLPELSDGESQESPSPAEEAPESESPAPDEKPEDGPAPVEGPEGAQEPAQEPTEASVPGPGDPGPATTQAVPVRVDNMSRRSDHDALEGLFCDIVSGPYEGRRGVFDRVLVFDRQTGYPKRILVITRDADNLMLDVAYEDARPSSSTGSR